jgi:hypothetical protein
MGKQQPQWRPIPGASMYEASDQGEVRSWRGWRGRRRTEAPRILKPALQHGYPTVSIVDDDGCKATFRVHRAVLLAFRGPRPPDMQTRHANGIRTDNRLSNLNYCTPSQNSRDQVRHGTHREARKTHCPAGHAYERNNTVIKGTGRHCRECTRERTRRRDRLNRASTRALREIAKLIAAETRPAVEIELILELIPPELLANPIAERRAA